MKFYRYGVICLLCLTMVILTGCQKSTTSVVNTRSGIVIHASDYTGELESVNTNTDRIRQVSAPTAKSSGRLIDLSGGYESIDMNTSFNRI